MKKKRKILGVALSAAALMAASVFGTMAYLTDTGAVSNTFTVGKVYISLDEADVNEAGQPLKDGKIVEKVDEADRWTPTDKEPSQKYHLLPGHSYTKDPTVTVEAGSEKAYVRMMAKVTYKAAADDVFAKYKTDNLFAPWLDIHGDWAYKGDPVTTKDETAGTISRTYEFRYKTTVAKSETATELPALFTTLTVPGGVTNDEIAYLENMVISVEAHAIQAAGFNDADAAWAAFVGKQN
ncbi:MAG: hypothetical protein IJB67_07945 [Firmicutes bacterium]|nr:hypothetical protein [Bacillota bacterium]MBQ3200278.1 hypothetical protein [Bacillota bacterium]